MLLKRICLFAGVLGLAVLPGEVLGADRPNVLLICVDDLRPELGCYGVEYIVSPNIDALAAEGVLFQRHYVQAPTCGASRFAMLTGTYGGSSNNALFERAQRQARGDAVAVSMPEWFRQHGYTTVSVGKVSHHPGGLGGKDWNDPHLVEMPEAWDRQLCPTGDWQHPRGVMHGLAHGEIREDATEMDVLQSVAGEDAIYPDGIMIEAALEQLEGLATDEQPFLLAVGIIRPHLPFGAPARYLQPYATAQLPPIPHAEKPSGRTTWHGSGEFMKYQRWNRDPNRDPAFATEVRRHYAACVSYADALVGRLLQRLDTSPGAENTIVVLWGDHGWHLGEHAIWGKHALFEESLRSPLVIRYPPRISEGEEVSTIVESIDIFPTLCELAELPTPADLDGESLVSLEQSKRDDATDYAISYFRGARSIRTPRFRLIEHDDGFIELYDHESDAGETKNIAQDRPAIVAELAKILARTGA